MSENTSHILRNVLIAVGVLLLGVVVLIAFLFLGDAPEQVSIENAFVAADPSASPATTSGFDGNADGTWAVDTESQPYSLEDSTGTFVGFRIAEELSSVGASTAVGRTPDVTGTITIAGTTLTAAIEIDGTTLTSATISADISALRTDESRRDNRARAAMGAASNPLTTFVLNIADVATVEIQLYLTKA